MEELTNIFSDIDDAFDGETIEADLFELRGRSSERRVKNSSEYVALLKRVYDFASAEDVDPNESYVIGNVLRRVLEGYSDEEKKKCAQCVMEILHKLDRVHLKKQLGDWKKGRQSFDRWSDIENHLGEWSKSFTPTTAP